MRPGSLVNGLLRAYDRGGKKTGQGALRTPHPGPDPRRNRRLPPMLAHLHPPRIERAR